MPISGIPKIFFETENVFRYKSLSILLYYSRFRKDINNVITETLEPLKTTQPFFLLHC